jgi:stage V sporulation protein R
MKHAYTLADLQELDERCRVEAEKFGLPLPQVLFHLMQSEEIYDISARGLPGRYSHHFFGRIYQEEKNNYDTGKSRIYEIIINTRPVYAYLLDGNSVITQLLVMAHCYGHAAFFENSKYFVPADKNILPRVRSAAERIDGYMGEYGREKIEDFIDACIALQDQRSYDILAKRPEAKPPKWEDKPFDSLFPQETEKRRKEWKRDKEAFRVKFPKQPERDILAFIEAHSHYLEDWQKDIISIIRTEQEYFVPQKRTQVLNEATAVFYHKHIVQKLMAEDDRFTTQDFMEFQAMDARVLHPAIHIHTDDFGEKMVHCAGINPYLTGTAIFNEVKRLCENPDEDDHERWPWAGQISFEEKRNQIITRYDDAAAVAEFITPRVCEEAKLFIRPRTVEEYKDLRVLKDEAEEVRRQCVELKTTFGIPHIEITNADWQRQSILYLEHTHTDKGLDDEYTQGTIIHLANLWGHRVVVETVQGQDPRNLQKVWYSCRPEESPKKFNTYEALVKNVASDG